MLKLGKIQDLNEANQEALQSVCTVNVNKIFALLHAKASVAAEAKQVKIENTAADGNDAKTAVFHSAGEHMIVARSPKEGEKISKETAKAGLIEYIKVFLGEDVAKKINDDEIFPLEGDGGSDEATKASGGSDSAGGDEDDEELDESSEFDIKFSQFISNGIALNEATDGMDDDGDTNDGDEEDGDSTDSDDDGDDDGGDDDGDDDGGDDDGDSDAGDADGDDEGKTDDDGEIEDKDITEADGFYVLYGLKIKGMKETTVQDALKKWGSNFLKGFGVKLGSMWGGGSGEVHTIGGAMETMSKLFGSIKMPDDTDEIKKNVEEKLRRKFPSLTDIKVDVRDKKTITSELDRIPRTGYDGKAKQKINSAEYSLYIDVDGDDVREPLLDRKKIANIVTLSISGLFKKFKHKISADDVIFLRGQSLGNKDDDRLGTDDIVPSPDELDGIVGDLPDERPQSPNEFKMKRPDQDDPEFKDEKSGEIDIGKYNSKVKEWKQAKADYDSELKKSTNYGKMVSSSFDKLVRRFKKTEKDKKKAKDKAAVQALLDVWNKAQKDFNAVKNDNEDELLKDRVKVLKSFLEEYSGKYDSLVLNESRTHAYDSGISLLCELFEDLNGISAYKMFEDDSDSNGVDDDDDDGAGDGDDGDDDDTEDSKSNEQTGKKDGEADSSDEAGGGQEEQSGSDLYIIPMPGIKAKDTDDDAWKTDK